MENKQPRSKHAKVIMKAWNDPQFKEQLLKNPIATLKEQGIEIPQGVKVTMCENTNKEIYLVLPCKPKEALSEEQLENLAAGYATSSEGDYSGTSWLYR